MPMWRRGNRNYIKICERCGREFVKPRGVRRKKVCNDCIKELRTRVEVPLGEKKTYVKRMIEELG